MDCAAIDRHANLIRSAGMVLCQLELPLETVSHTLALCAQAAVPSFSIRLPPPPLPDAVFRQASWFTPNETEAAFYLKSTCSPEQAALRLLTKASKALSSSAAPKAPTSPFKARPRG